MRTRNFEIPTEIIFEVSEVIEREELTATITGVTDDGEIEVSIDFEPEQKEAISEIHEIIDDYQDEHGDDDEDEDDDD